MSDNYTFSQSLCPLFPSDVRDMWNEHETASFDEASGKVKVCYTTLSWNTVPSLLNINFAFACLVSIDDVVFIVFENFP